MRYRLSRLLFFLFGLLLGVVLIAGFTFPQISAWLDQRFPWLARKPGQAEQAVLYLAPSGAPELWLASSDGRVVSKLTESGGNIYDYAAWPDGSQIIYSAGNELNGLSLWVVGRNGGKPELWLDCGADRCFEPAVSSNGQRIAYSRKNAAENPGGGAGVSRIWLMEEASRATVTLYPDARIVGQMPSWSPDGKYLAFFNPRELAIQIHPLTGGMDILAPTSVNGVGGWDPLKPRMIFASLVQGPENTAGVLLQVDPKNGLVSPILENLGLFDFTHPQFSPDGERLAVTARDAATSGARQLWVVNISDAQKYRLLDDEQVSQAGFHWDGQGRYLLYQQLRLGSSSERPEIYRWDSENRSQMRVAQDAFQPGWLPQKK